MIGVLILARPGGVALVFDRRKAPTFLPPEQVEAFVAKVRVDPTIAPFLDPSFFDKIEAAIARSREPDGAPCNNPLCRTHGPTTAPGGDA